jgi:hypothetical protein
MATWLGVLVQTQGKTDFWEAARQCGVEALGSVVPEYALMECAPESDSEAPIHLAEALSRELSTTSIGFVIQTVVDVHELHVFREGTVIRRLVYSRDDGGWRQVEGETQPWERAYFFEEKTSALATTSEQWPDMLYDELSDEEVARYEAAKRAGDATQVLDLLHPSSTEPMSRVCAFLSVDASKPHGRWKKPSKPSLWSRLFGRGGTPRPPS